MDNFVGVACVKELCPVCLKEIDGPVILNRILTEKAKEEVEKLHGKVVGYSEHPCDDCKKYLEMGIIVIGYDKSKTKDMNNPYRSGHIIVIKEEYFTRNNMPLPESKIIYVDVNQGIQLGFFKESKEK